VTDRGPTKPIERRRVSRKTPGDGKLEITKVAAGKLQSLGSRFPVIVDAQAGDARLVSMPCTCRGDDTPHVHYFVESDLLRSLVAGSDVDLVLDDDGKRLVVEPA
jgi:hypothetical protein